jgi:hypothetical protein
MWWEVKDGLNYRPFWVVAAFILAAGVWYPPHMLDSLTYRIPRILLWLREGQVAFLGSAESRLDYLGHGWELCNVPIVLLLGVRWVWLWNFVAWLISYLLFNTWARQFGQPQINANRFALIASASAFGVLQASNTGNDIFATAFLLLGVHFLVNYESDRSARWINWSALCLCLAAAIKVHFTVLFLPFGIWFWLARSRPWRAYAWRRAPAWAIVFLFCSPAPTFVLNHLHFGQITGPSADALQFAGAGPLTNVLCGAVLMLWQMLQPRINPLAFSLNQPLIDWVASTGVHQLAPRFEMRMVPVAMVDNASIGTITFVAVLIGLWLALRHRREWLGHWAAWTALAGVVGFCIAVSRFLPSTVGRSFAGFVFLVFPLAMLGWTRLSERAQRVGVVLSVMSGVLVLVLTPLRPLWPAATLRDWMERRGNTAIAGALETYLKVSERAMAGSSLVAAIPPEETSFVALIGGEDPLLPTLTTGDSLQKVVLLSPNSPVETITGISVRHVLVSGMAIHSFPEICAYLERGDHFQLVRSAEYTSKLARGPETWRLYRRVESPPPGSLQGVDVGRFESTDPASNTRLEN